MLINIEEIKNDEETLVAFSETFKIPDEYGLLCNDIVVNVEGGVRKLDYYFSFEGKVSTKVAAECGSCLKPVEETLEFQMESKFSETLDSYGLDDVGKIVSKNIDLSDAVLSNLLIEIPVKFACINDCKGLCKFCGNDLNINKCSCEDEQVDERFAKFKDFF